MTSAHSLQTRILQAGERDYLNHLKNKFQEKLKEDKAFVRQAVCKKTDGRTLLIRACGKGYLNVVRYLVTVCGADVNQIADWSALSPDIQGASPLLCAVIAGHQGIVKVLISAGADINSTTHTKWTPLKAATCLGDPDIVQTLLDEGADVELAVLHGPRCSVANWTERHDRIGNILRRKANETNNISYALPINMFILLSIEKIDLKYWNTLSTTLGEQLHMIVDTHEKEDEDHIDLHLLFRQADVLLQYIVSESEKNSEHVLESCLPVKTLDAIWRVKDKVPKEAFDNYKMYFCKLIALDKGRKRAYTLLHWVCYEITFQPPPVYIPILMELGANINAKDEYGNTPLHVAVLDLGPESGNIVDTLLQHDAHIDIVNDDDLTPMDCQPEDGILVSSLSQPLRYQTLQCFAARAVCKYNVPYDKDLVTKICIEIIEQHRCNALSSEEN